MHTHTHTHTQTHPLKEALKKVFKVLRHGDVRVGAVLSVVADVVLELLQVARLCAEGLPCLDHLE